MNNFEQPILILEEMTEPKEGKMAKVKKVLAEIVKIGGWIIIALEKLLEVM